MIHKLSDVHPSAKIGDQVEIGPFTSIAADVEIGEGTVALAGHVEVGDWAIISGLSAVHQFVKIGNHVMVGGGAMVRKDIPPFITAAGDPLTYAGVNSVGLRRRSFHNEAIREIQDIYRILYQSGKNISQALEVVKAEYGQSAVAKEIIAFIDASDRGLIRK